MKCEIVNFEKADFQQLDSFADRTVFQTREWVRFVAQTQAATPVLAQILAVADAYEAMTSRRPHRPALPRDEAVAQLRKNAGTQFAPNVVEAFVAASAQPLVVSAVTEASLLRRLAPEQA